MKRSVTSLLLASAVPILILLESCSGSHREITTVSLPGGGEITFLEEYESESPAGFLYVRVTVEGRETLESATIASSHGDMADVAGRLRFVTCEDNAVLGLIHLDMPSDVIWVFDVAAHKCYPGGGKSWEEACQVVNRISPCTGTGHSYHEYSCEVGGE